MKPDRNNTLMGLSGVERERVDRGAYTDDVMGRRVMRVESFFFCTQSIEFTNF